ncbi:MAG TPA: FAD/NAD(P)-binding oxidoreductase [Anaeromyxobacteraceae bacterium]|nr:FAD/NAD(P)-binding oxidoreductase [Anaeromyxobacteraceae bacterium]
MNEVTHLIVGGGMAGHAAAAAIRELDRDGALGMLAAEPDRPYARPPLSKGLWFGKPEEKIWLPDVPGLDLRLGCRAVALDAKAREVRDDRGGVHRYEKLLLATGGEPRRLPTGGDRVIYLRTLQDYRRLRGVAGKAIVVIGGGFIGSEIAAALAASGKKVTLVFPEDAIGARNYPADLARSITRYFEEKGVQVLANDTVADVDERGGRTHVRTSKGHELVADAVVAGLGIRPDTTLAQEAGIVCGDGIEVDERLQTSAPGVYAAGDVARFPSAALGGRARVEHEDAALGMGRLAGRNMAGAGERWEQLPFFYSDVFDLGYEAVGRLDARLETVESWETPFRKGVVYYMEGARVRGVLLFGVFGQVDAARELVQGERPVRREALADAIPA